MNSQLYSSLSANRRCAIRRFAMFCIGILSALTADQSLADPCGMVPPLYLPGQVDLQRIGLQKTFVFYKDGVETFVIRPGFQGSVAEFGMLIPFPSPPSLRKVADNTFAHIAAAIDPPEVVVDLTPVEYYRLSEAVSDMAAPTAAEESSLKLDEVRVLKQEAVGMYEVAVLEAGSAFALNQWMTDHGYRYPEGMDEVCNDYVADGWCFVAIKARVGQKDGVDPKPGMESADPSLPEGMAFDGHVQGMGFRFKSKELVVPMRLSAFNEGDLHNVVYLLTENPMKARDLPADKVVRQISGQQLLHNITQPLPLRIIGGTYADIPESRLQQLKSERDPTPHNGIAKELFAGDLVSARTGKLSHHHEELEKELLDIGERLALRGPGIDALHHGVLAALQKEETETSLSDLESMTMTVIDGDFERDLVAADNIYFTRFEMNPTRNTPQRYNARIFGPSAEGAIPSASVSSTPKAVAVTHPTAGRLILQESAAGNGRTNFWLPVAGVLLTLALVAVAVIWRRGRSAAGLLLICTVFPQSHAQDSSAPEVTVDELVEMLTEIHESADRTATVGRITALGDRAVPALLELVGSEQNIEDRGWAVICLKEIGGDTVTKELVQMSQQPALPSLVRVWTAAAAVDHVKDLGQLTPFAQLATQFPALVRPLNLRITSLLQQENGSVDAEAALKLCTAVPSMQQILAPVVLKIKPELLTTVLMTSPDISTRQQAAAWLATMKQQQIKGINQSVVTAVEFKKDAQTVPWGDGPLFIPGVNWEKQEAILLINELTAWYVWASKNNQPESISKIVTNLNSRQLMNAAGFNQVPGDVIQWLSIWRSVIGDEAMATLMKRTGYQFVPAAVNLIEE